VKNRQWPDHPQARHWALRFATADMVIALAMAFLVKAAILDLAGGAFHGRGLPLVLPCWRQGRVPYSRAPWPVRW